MNRNRLIVLLCSFFFLLTYLPAFANQVKPNVESVENFENSAQKTESFKSNFSTRFKSKKKARKIKNGLKNASVFFKALKYKYKSKPLKQDELALLGVLLIALGALFLIVAIAGLVFALDFSVFGVGLVSALLPLTLGVLSFALAVRLFKRRKALLKGGSTK